MTRLRALTRRVAIITSASLTAVGGIYGVFKTKRFENLRKSIRNQIPKRYLINDKGHRMFEYEPFVELDHSSIASIKNWHELSDCLLVKQYIPINADIMAFSLSDVQCTRLSYRIPFNIALQLATRQRPDNGALTCLIYAGIPASSTDSLKTNSGQKKRAVNNFVKTDRKSLLSALNNIETKGDALEYVANGGLQRLLTTMSSNDHRIVLQVILRLSSLVEEKEIFLQSGWIRKLSELADNEADICNSVDAVACLANMVASDVDCKFIDRLLLPLHLPFYNSHLYLADIIFVHGVWGSSYYTWRQENTAEIRVDQSWTHWLTSRMIQNTVNCCGDAEQGLSLCWPRDWLSNDLSYPVRIFALNYETSSAGSLSDITRDIRKRFKSTNIGTKPIIWVGHSMGGLIIKELVNQYSDLRDVTASYVFYSVPHHGVPIVNQSMSLFSAVLENLVRSSPRLKQQHEQWLDGISDQGSILSIIEGLPIKFMSLSYANILIVDPASADAGVGETFTLAGKDHIQVCKPRSKDAEEYKLVVRFLNRVLDDCISNNNKLNENQSHQLLAEIGDQFSGCL